MKIRDTILLGVIAGTLAGFPARLTNNTAYKLGLTDQKYGQMAASLFLPADKQKVHRREAQVVGFLADYINCGIMGVTVVQLLARTGRDNAILRGIGVSALAWMSLYGLTTRLKVAPPSRKPLSSILSFADHVIFGALCGWLVEKLGYGALFPRRQAVIPRAQPSLGSSPSPSHAVQN